MTQHYVGTKIVLAWAAEKDGKPGYGLRYPDGYISWSPKDVFEEAYLPLGHIDSLPPFAQRLAAEKAQLADRVQKLGQFLETSVTQYQLGKDEREDLQEQYVLMRQYQTILERRLVRILNKN